MEKTKLLEKIINEKETCACGKVHGTSLKYAVIEKNAIQKLPGVISNLGDFKNVVMICDENTYKAAGKKAEEFCNFKKTVCLSPEGLHATENAVEKAESFIDECDLLVAIGSGTIHDITRFIAHKRNIDFVSVPTAASVDGFVSGVAAMTWHGVKRTFPAVPPVALVADSTVISKAPYYLTASGVGDLLGKYTALFDWRVSSMLTGEYICEYIIDLEMKAIKEVVDNLEKIKAMDDDAVESLTYGLVLSGIAMQMAGNSRPASGSEHHISHLIEMETVVKGNTACHGEKVGVAAALIAERYHKALETPFSNDRFSDYSELPVEKIREVYKDLTDEVIKNENTPDPLSKVDRAVLAEKWEDIRKLAKETLPDADEIRDLLRRCGASVTLSDINISEDLANTLCEFSPFVRARLTFMRILKLVK